MTPSQDSRSRGFLLTDHYHLTSSQLYFRMGLHERPVQFDHFFRSYPNYGEHQAGYCVTAGLEWLLDWMQETRATADDLAYMGGLRGATGEPLFDRGFLAWLAENGNFSQISMRAIPEGRVVHANVPLTVVEGPLAMAQILETPLLNHLNYQTLIATKAARIHSAGRGRPLLEFGLRRAPADGASAGTRAALIGGADATSNIGMARELGCPPRGTHAHSLVQVFLALGEGEIGAFRAFAEVYPDDCLLLVDTIDTLDSGVPNAIRVFEELRRKGHRPLGIRLDSGDLAYLAIQAAAMLDSAGFQETSIVLSSGLDELAIWQILTQIEEEAPRYGLDADKLIGRLVYGVGTNLITSGSTGLNGVYKAVALGDGDSWKPMLKLSEAPRKTPNPGAKTAWRVYDRRGQASADVLAGIDETPPADDGLTLHHPVRRGITRTLERDEISEIETLLVPVLDHGRRLAEPEPLDIPRGRRQADLDRLDPGVRRLINPHVYHVSLTTELWELKRRLVAETIDAV
jgi:nicotinate phosphoribosyltransferase